MKTIPQSVLEFIQNIPPERKDVFKKLHQTILDKLPTGFKPEISYGGLWYVIPHELYPAGYHCKPSEPLPFAGISSQKAGIHFYHMGMYAQPELLNWFLMEYPKHCSHKPDVGKSCVRFKKIEQIPFVLIGELMEKMTAQEWIELYERLYKPKK